MELVICKSKEELGREAGKHAAALIRAALADKGQATIVLATGTSQFETLKALVGAPEIDWSHVTAFHLDEYLGLSESHPASFRRFLRERFVERLPQKLAAFHYVNGEADPAKECARLGGLIGREHIDVALIGIGENGHLAFNDPPADLETDEPYIVVELDEACRRQQLGEGWFPSLEEVPRRAISMSIRQIMRAERIICSVPEQRKAQAVLGAVEGPVTPELPASILQRHPAVTLYLDRESASLLCDGP